jgi:ATP-binding cassette subfamily B protein
MNGEDDMPNSDPPEFLTTDDVDDEPILDAAAVASMLATADGRSGDRAYIDYLTAINEVISTDAVTQMDGVTRLGRLLGDPVHAAAARAVLEGFLAEAESESRAGDGLSPSAALLAKDLLCGPAPAPRPVPKPSPEPSAETVSAGGVSPVQRPPGGPDKPAHHWGRATAALLSRAMRGRWLLWHAALGAAALAGLGNLGYAMAVEKIAGRPGHHPAGLTTVLCVAGGIVALALLRAGGVYLSRVLTERAHIDLAAADRRQAVDAYLARPQSWTDRRARDSALDVVQGDQERVWYAATAFPFAVGTVVAALVAVAVAWNADPFAGAAVGAGLAAVAALTLRELNSVTASSEKARELTAAVRVAATECVDAAGAADATGTARHGGTRLAAQSGTLRDERIRADVSRGRFTALVESAPIVVLLTAAVLMAVRVDSASAVVLVAVVLTVMAAPVRAAAWLVGELPAAVVREGHAQRPVAADHDGRDGLLAAPDVAPGSGELRFEAAGLSRAGRTTLPGLDLVVADGQVVAVVGATPEQAAAITTLAAGIDDPSTGAVVLDGADVRTLTEDALAGRVLLVPSMTRLGGMIAAAAGEPRLLVVDGTDGSGGAADDVPAAVRSGVARSALVVTDRRAVLACADEVLYLSSGCVAARGTHDWLLQHVEGYAALVIGVEGADRPEPADHAAEDCAEHAISEAVERHHLADRIAAAAAGPRCFTPLRRTGPTCHAHRTTSGPHSGGRRHKDVSGDATRETPEPTAAERRRVPA